MKKIFYSLILLLAVVISNSSYAQRGYYDRGPAIVNRPWSPTAKTAVLGAGGGAILGALLSRDHGQGALIGAILGGGAGYLYGRGQERGYQPGYSDHRNERYQDRRDDYDRGAYRDRDEDRQYNNYRYSGGYSKYGR